MLIAKPILKMKKMWEKSFLFCAITHLVPVTDSTQNTPPKHTVVFNIKTLCQFCIKPLVLYVTDALKGRGHNTKQK